MADEDKQKEFRSARVLVPLLAACCIGIVALAGLGVVDLAYNVATGQRLFATNATPLN